MRGVRVKDFPSYFWSNVDKKGEDDCWEWKLYKSPIGYGEVSNYYCHGMKSRMAHRISYTLTNGEIPEGMLVCHKCDNPACCNPSHLFIGTQKDNMQDCVSKGRKSQGKAHSEIIRAVAPRGEANKRAKLTEADVLAIRADTRTLREIADDYCMNANYIWRIKKRLNWSHL